jgi:hypothetical protein
MVPCEKCPSTATHYPRVYFQRETCRMGVIVQHPRCESHQVPIVESYLNRHEVAVYSARFEAEYGSLPDVTRTKVVFVLAESQEVKDFLDYLDKSKEARAKENMRAPMIVEFVPEGEIPLVGGDS